MRLHVSLFIVFCTVKFIDASCLSYGHSCWGAHGKRSYNPPRELKPGELNDRWELVKIMPERNDFLQFKKIFRDSANLQTQYPEVPMKSLNFPSIDQLSEESEETNQSNDKENSKVGGLSQDSVGFQRRQPFQYMRLNKHTFEQ